MTKIKHVMLLILLLLAGGTEVFSQDKNISYAELIKRLTDLKALSELPVEGEASAMWASYDRRSKVDPASGEFIEWSANDDGFTPQYIRKEGDKMVLAEMEGPGAIVRIWSASPAKGHIKVFIDGEELPAVDLPFIDFFNTASIPAFAYPELVYETAARGFNNYIPIPYQKSCKIVADPEWGQYYHFNYITFPEGTRVEGFEAQPKAENTAALEKVSSFFANDLGKLPYEVDKTKEKKVELEIPAGGSKTIQLKGRQAIYSFKASLSGIDEERLDEALRKLILEITWDDEDKPAVWSPIGDFFGSAPGFNLYSTLPMGMTEEAMYSYWYMPFEKSASIKLTNNLGEAVQVNLAIGLEKIKTKGKQLARFHAKWHRNLSQQMQDSTRWPDWTVLETEGRGRFLGMSLMVWNPKGGSCTEFGGEGHWWWGEGDEKFFVDGETFPSTFGTGTEDYFGYAWCIPEYFSHPFHSQSYTDDNMGYQSLNRWQVIDNVPFQKSFKGYLEKYFPDHWPTQYAVTTYWYLNKGGEDPIVATPVDELYGFENPYQVFREVNGIEGEELKIGRNTGGWPNQDAFVHEKIFKEVSGHKILHWDGNPEAENGSELVTTFKIDKAGKYKITARVVTVPDGGKFQLSLNDQVALEALSMKGKVGHGKPEEIELGTFELEQGEQEMKFKWLQTEGYGRRFLLDFINVESIP